jgi:hypothetical protein
LVRSVGRTRVCAWACALLATSTDKGAVRDLSLLGD